MGKAEERALSKFPILKTQLGDINYLPRISFVDGYHQAEKDLELSWEDIKYLDELILYVYKKENLRDNELYKEVLKHFNKERKEQ